jgi:hypothetical protein
MSKMMDTRVAALVSLVVVAYGVGLFRGSNRLALVLQAANVASDMSGTWERSDTWSVHVLIRRYEHHAWYVLVGSYADPRDTVQPLLGARVAKQIRGHGDERGWVLYTVLDNGRVLPAVDVRVKSYEKNHVLAPHDVVVVKNVNTDAGTYELLEVIPGQSR